MARSVDLVPGGSDIAVTLDNRQEYIQLVCKYKLDKQIAAQSRAFFTGLSDIIDQKCTSQASIPPTTHVHQSNHITLHTLLRFPSRSGLDSTLIGEVSVLIGQGSGCLIKPNYPN